MKRRDEDRLRQHLNHLRRAQEQQTKEQERFPHQPKPSTQYALTQAVEGVVEFVKGLAKDG